jgi:hypothetical protein
MGAFAFAGKKFAGIACGILGVFFGLVFFVMGVMNSNYQWSTIVGIIIFLAGFIFGIYFWKSADRHV